MRVTDVGIRWPLTVRLQTEESYPLPPELIDADGNRVCLILFPPGEGEIYHPHGTRDIEAERRRNNALAVLLAGGPAFALSWASVNERTQELILSALAKLGNEWVWQSIKRFEEF